MFQRVLLAGRRAFQGYWSISHFLKLLGLRILQMISVTLQWLLSRASPITKPECYENQKNPKLNIMMISLLSIKYFT